MDRISSHCVKLTKEQRGQKKLNFCRTHFGRVFFFLVLTVVVVVQPRVVWAQFDDDFQEQPLGEKPALPEENTSKLESEPALESEPTLETNSLTSEELKTEPPLTEPLMQQPIDNNLVEVQGAEVPLVEVRERPSINSPYRDRRNTFGGLFSIGAENLFMADYLSLLDDNYYEDLFGDSDISLFGVELGLKYNFSLGSLALSAGYSMGSITDNRVGQERKLEISKPYLELTYYLDTLMKEPYVVPYIGGEVWTMMVKEQAITSQVEDSLTTDVGFSFKVGLLFQLNWLDKDAAQSGYSDFHIQNTFLDVYAIQNTETQGEGDPNTSSDFNWGAGLKIEF